MPGLVQKIDNSSDDCNETNTNYQNSLAENGTMPYDSNNVFWSKHRDDVSLDQLEKFWCELTPQARQKLLRVDKQTLFEHARKNMYCSRCNGLLLEGFLEIVMHGKSLQQDATGGHYSGGDASKHNHGDLCTASEGDVLNLSVHRWGGLSTSRDGTLTLLDCYIYSKSLQGLHKVFDGAHERERQRKLLYPDGCGGGGRGWISQGYSRGHGTRETCALHTARLSVDTLIGFWSALGEETQQSLLRMKEEDFTERLMYRFESKRFCRDCRRNVIREFKELKELKRIRREPCCTSWFCAADTAFQYEVSDDTVQADWHQTFLDAFGTYSHFEWAIGTGKGKSDILEFENVGLSGRVQVNGLDLSSLNACYITVQAWKEDVCCTELSVKAHAMQGQQCVHGRLVVGDGYLTISIGENIRRFFEHAEEVEEEEDDDTRDKEGNEFDGECSRPQKHAKSPELAREFLLDAATVIFKEQVEKAFREETARQNAHSIFVCLALNMLEERVHVACKEIVTLEKQMKLLEEEEKEKREEEERKERRKTKEREKKLRRKERLREKENKEKNCADANIDPMVPEISNELPSCVDERSTDSVSETGEATPADPLFPDIQDEQLLMSYTCPNMKNNFEDTLDGEFGNAKGWNTSFPKLKFRKDTQQDLPLNWSNRRKGSAFSENSRKHESRFHTDAFESSSSIKGFNKQLRTKAAKSNTRNDCSKLNEKLQCTSDRIGDRYDSHACGLNNHKEYTSKSESHIMRAVGESKYRLDEMNGRAKNNINARRTTNAKKVWEPLDSRKRYAKSNSDSDIALNATTKGETSEADQLHVPSGAASSDEMRDISVQTKTKANDVRDLRMSSCRERENKFHSMAKFPKYSEVVAAKDGELCSMARSPKTTVDSWSNSDNCSSCLSEGASNASSSNLQNLESVYASDSEECIQNSEIRETSHYLESKFTDCRSAVEHQSTPRGKDAKSRGRTYSSPTVTYCQSGRANVSMNAQHQSVLPPMHNQNMHYPVVQAPTLGYYHQSPVSWTAGHTNGLMSYPYSNHYLIANTLGYGLNCNNAQFIQYGPLQHLPAPLLNPVHRVPVLPLVTRTNGISTKEHCTNVADIGLLKEERHSIQKVVHCTEKHSAEENGKSDKADKGNNDGFSLFHFGGPLALSTVFKSDTVSSNEESVDNTYTCANLSDNNGDGNQHPWNKKDSIEEYNLFAAASNGIRFSIF